MWPLSLYQNFQSICRLAYVLNLWIPLVISDFFATKSANWWICTLLLSRWLSWVFNPHLFNVWLNIFDLKVLWDCCSNKLFFYKSYDLFMMKKKKRKKNLKNNFNSGRRQRRYCSVNGIVWVKIIYLRECHPGLILLTSPPFCQTRGKTIMFQMCHFYTGIFKAKICLQNSGWG